MASSKRELISPRGDKRFVRRDAKGRITESDDVGRSLTQDRRRAAKATAKPGQGDKGDRKDSTASARKSAGTKASASKASASRRGATAKPATKAASKASASRKTATGKTAAKKGAPRKSTTTGAAAKNSARGTTRKASSRKAASRSTGRATAPNAIQLLKADHATVRALLAQLEATTPRGTKARQELLARIRREIDVHSAIEEEIFYPAFEAAGKRGDDQKMYFEALEEHRAAGDLVLPDLLDTDPASDRFGGRAKVLKELVEHHAREEEKEMFPRARELLSDAELKALGERMLARKTELMAAPAPPKSMAGRLLSAVVGAITPAGPGDNALAEAAGPDAKGNRNGAAPLTER